MQAEAEPVPPLVLPLGEPCRMGPQQQLPPPLQLPEDNSPLCLSGAITAATELATQASEWGQPQLAAVNACDDNDNAADDNNDVANAVADLLFEEEAVVAAYDEAKEE